MTKSSTARVDRRQVAKATSGVKLDVGDETYRLRLSMSAMRDIEEEFGLESISGLAEVMRTQLGTKTLGRIIGPMIRAGGTPEFKDADVAGWDVDFMDVVNLVAKVIAGDSAPAAEATPGE